MVEDLCASHKAVGSISGTPNLKKTKKRTLEVGITHQEVLGLF